MNRQKQGAGQEPVRPAGGRDSLYVTSSASFWNANSGERPGVRLPFRGEFQWGGSRWVAVIQVKDTPQEETAATAVMKGEDGPAAVLVGVQSQSQGERSTRVALSALRFELAETVTWLPVFSGAVPEALAVELEKQGSP